MVKISVAIATYNEEKNLKTCLESVYGWVGEIVIVDGGSSDKTCEIGGEFKAKIFSSNNPIIFHLNKQKAIEKCRGEWILQLDADEIVTMDLKEEILHVINKESNYNGYFIPRENSLLGRKMKKGGLWPDYVIRLFKNGYGKFPCKTVHEQIEIKGKVGYVKNPLIHNAYPKFSNYLRKANTYTSLTAFLLEKEKKEKGIMAFLNYLFIKPVETFFTLFVRSKGFMDGFPGFVWAFFSSLHYQVAYLKYLLNKKNILKLSLYLTIFLSATVFLKSNVFAFDYVLPYPSYMPSHKLYKAHQIFEKAMEYFYFGNLTQYKYHLQISDKYLVEAKTLFEYKQYRLALISLARSDDHFDKAGLSLLSAANEGKNIQDFKNVLISAKEKHISVIDNLLGALPETISWHEEKKNEEILDIKNLLTISKKQRKLAVSILN